MIAASWAKDNRLIHIQCGGDLTKKVIPDPHFKGYLRVYTCSGCDYEYYEQTNSWEASELRLELLQPPVSPELIEHIVKAINDKIAMHIFTERAWSP